MLKRGVFRHRYLPKISIRFATDVAVKLSLGEKGPNSCFWW
jgi:hypothetical protein